MQIADIELKDCLLNLGELHRLADYGYFNPVFKCVTNDGDEFAAPMRLHITEPLDPIVFLDPRSYSDLGITVNSVNSPVLRRRRSYVENGPEPWSEIFVDEVPHNVRCYRISKDQIRRTVLNGYSLPDPDPEFFQKREIAFTCHDPSLIGGGNLILFRYINWLAKLGVKVKVYSCGSWPFWTKVSAEFRFFQSYEELFGAIDEKIVILFAMWHIEPMLRTRPYDKRIFMFHQGAVSYHYGPDTQSMLAEKPVIDLLESLPLGVIAVSPYLFNRYGTSDRKEIYFIPNGVELPVLPPSDRIIRDSDSIRIVTVGSPSSSLKGTTIVASALTKLAGQNKSTRFRWTACSGDNAVYVPNGIDGIHNIEYEHRLKLNRQEIIDVYRNADIFVNASLNEGFGLPSLESMCCGTPVIQADNGGLGGIVEDGRDCLVVPINDADALADAIMRIMSDRGLLMKLIDNAYETAQRNGVLNQFRHFYPAFEDLSGVKFDADRLEKIRDGIKVKYVTLPEPKSETSDGNNGPLVSIVIPTYNQAEYLKEALDSITSQTYRNWEAIVVNDGSRDHTVEVMEHYARLDKRIRVFSKENGGISSALNHGIERALGDYFCWLSSDDLFYDYKLELQVNKFKELGDDYALIYSGYDLLIQERNERIITNTIKPIESGSEFPEMLKHDFIYGCSVMVRMDIIRDLGAFHPRYRHAQDTEFFLRIASRGYRFYLMNEKLAIRREHVEQASTGNIIYCRYDAVSMIHYYLARFHLFEMYRYFSLSNRAEIDRFINHLSERLFGDDPTVMHPILRERFWDWVDDGLALLPPDVQVYILKGCLRRFSRMIMWYPDIGYFVRRVKKSLKKTRTRKRAIIDYTIDDNRDIFLNSREEDEDNAKLYLYVATLLVNDKAPLFAQTLELHNTNRLVNNRFKLAHSAIRYLSQYKNEFQNKCASFSDISLIPENQDEATRLFYRLYFPEVSSELIAATDFLKTGTGTLPSNYEQIVRSITDEGKDLVKRICKEHSKEKVLYFWNAILLADEMKYSKAIISIVKVRAGCGTPRRIVLGKFIVWARMLNISEVVNVIKDVLRESFLGMRTAAVRPLLLVKDLPARVMIKMSNVLGDFFRQHLNRFRIGNCVFEQLKILRNKILRIQQG